MCEGCPCHTDYSRGPPSCCSTSAFCSRFRAANAMAAAGAFVCRLGLLQPAIAVAVANKKVIEQLAVPCLVCMLQFHSRVNHGMCQGRVS